MDMQPVSSSNLEAVGYDPATKELHVRFKSGSTAQYFDVPEDVHQQLVSAPSVGKHYHQHIKGRFPRP